MVYISRPLSGALQNYQYNREAHWGNLLGFLLAIKAFWLNWLEGGRGWVPFSGTVIDFLQDTTTTVLDATASIPSVNADLDYDDRHAGGIYDLAVNADSQVQEIQDVIEGSAGASLPEVDADIADRLDGLGWGIGNAELHIRQSGVNDWDSWKQEDGNVYSALGGQVDSLGYTIRNRNNAITQIIYQREASIRSDLTNTITTIQSQLAAGQVALSTAITAEQNARIAAINSLRTEVLGDLSVAVTALQNTITSVQTTLNTRISAEVSALWTAVTQSRNDWTDALIAEQNARVQGFTSEAAARVSGIAAEADARAQAITSEAAARTQGIVNEITARAAAILQLSQQMSASDQAEVQARIAAVLQARSDLQALVSARETAIRQTVTDTSAALNLTITQRSDQARDEAIAVAEAYTDATEVPITAWITQESPLLAWLQANQQSLQQVLSRPAEPLCDALQVLPISCVESYLVKLWDAA